MTLLHGNSQVTTLRRFMRAPAWKTAVEEGCELCSVRLDSVHRHLIESASGRIVCACDPCALRFHDVEGGRFQLIPRDARRLREFQMTDAQWADFAFPIDLVFFFHSSARGKVAAFYPGPVGATESLLPLQRWTTLVAQNPILHEMASDVEALLVNRVGNARRYYIAPIGVCYELIGLIRTHWRGLSGGELVWEKIDAFFDRLDQQDSSPMTAAQEEGVHA